MNTLGVLLTVLTCIKLVTATNPFLDRKFYVNPANANEYEKSIATATGTTKINLQRMQTTPSAYWIDTKDKVRGTGTRTVEGILSDAASKSPPELVVLIWYDLPNRDCDALASNGEICCYTKEDGSCDYVKPGDCAEGIAEYKRDYVTPFIEVLKEYESMLPIVVVLEPDSLPNLATNIDHPKCGNIATQTAYREGAKFALQQLAENAPSVSVYIDAAHGGWLGWDSNLGKFMTTLKKMELPMNSVRGFATNVANYQSLGIQCPWCPDQGFRNGYCLNNKHASDPCCADPCDLLSQYNFGNNELNYAAGLVAAAGAILGMEAHVIIDTGRNGVSDQRSDCKNWCNPRGSGTGVPSTTNTANISLVDAYFWLKTPGESDGCSETLPDGSTCPRFDAKCGSIDSLGSKDGEPPAVEAGQWFDYQVKRLADNAVFEPSVVTSSLSRSTAVCSAGAGQAATAVHITSPAMPTPTESLSTWTSDDFADLVPMLSGEISVVDDAEASNSVAPINSVPKCAAVYQQCGGTSWPGPTCCNTGCSCVAKGSGYSQCVPPKGTYQCSVQPGAETQILMKKYMLSGALFRQVGASSSSGHLLRYTALLAGVATITIAIVAWAWRVLRPVRSYGGLYPPMRVMLQ